MSTNASTKRKAAQDAARLMNAQDGCDPVQAVDTCRAMRGLKTRVALVLAVVAVLQILGFHPAAQARNASASLQPSPTQLIAATIANELKGAEPGIHLAYTASERDADTSRMKKIVETPDGSVSMIVAQGGQPLSAEKLRDQEQSLLKLVGNPADWAAHNRKQQRDDSEEKTLLRSLPDAFIFEQTGIRADGDSQIVTLHFSPNPNFHPPSRESQVFQGMRGVMEISLPAARIVRIEGTLFQPVNFGWGMLGRLNSGGRFLIEQAPVEKGRWEVTHTVLRFTGKIMLFKNLNIDEESHNTDFHSVPSLSLNDAVHLIAQPVVISQNGVRP